MNWTEILKFLGGSTVLLGAVGFVIKSIAKHFLNRDLESLKDKIKSESDQELQAFKGAQETALQKMRASQEERMEQMRQEHATVLQNIQSQANERIEHVKAAQQRVERLESELLKSRDEAYDEIWKLTGAINLFGSPTSVNYDELSLGLTHWYFPKGRVLTEDSKSRYFLVQEVLNFLSLRKTPLKRPSGEILFSGNERTIDAVRTCRTRQLGVAAKGNEGSYTLQELAECVSHCKQKFLAAPNETEPSEVAWLLLQFVMSAFRSGLVEELGSRDHVQSLRSADDVNGYRSNPANGATVVSSLGAQHTG